jgi:2-phosphosulfolactate phosphatase
VTIADAHVFDQAPYRLRLEWGRRAAAEAADRGDAVIIVDALRFTSTVVTAVEHGAAVYPCADDDDAPALAERAEAELAARGAFDPGARFSLSPRSFVGAFANTRVVLPSPNGSTCARIARHAPYVFAGAFLNASALGSKVSEVILPIDRSVTVVPCGERWPLPGEDGPLRHCFEDYAAAGAIIHAITLDASPEARAAEGAFLHVRDDLQEALLDCASARELRARGMEDDVRFAARLDAYTAVPELRGDRFEQM